MRILIGLLFMVIGIAVGIYLPFVYMLYGGIMQAVNSWGLDNSLVVWGIIRAIFFEAGFIPAIILIAVGAALLSD